MMEHNNGIIETITKLCEDNNLVTLLDRIVKEFNEPVYDIQRLLTHFNTMINERMNHAQRLDALIQSSVELVSKDAPKWEFIAARFLSYKLNQQVNHFYAAKSLHTLAEKVRFLIDQGYYGSYLNTAYTDDMINQCEQYMDLKRDDLFNYSGLDLLVKRYLVRSATHELLETPQQMFMLISMHLAMNEVDKVGYAMQFYDMISTLKVTLATPTLSNARKVFHQMSSCFIDTVGDDLKSIYKSLDNFANISKYGGGMGLYFGKVRANGSDIRGYQGAAGGVIRWIKLVNDTAVAVDQLGVRSGACAVYLDAWHKDLPEFLQLRTNNGDDRMKAHDIFPAVCYPDYFWELADTDLNAAWYLMCPHEIESVKGYCLEDSYGDQWKRNYLDCVNDSRISKRIVSVKEIIRLILKSAIETGTPFVFNRDIVNRMNPNKHKGMIYSSNLCTEITQNMSAIEQEEEKIMEVNGEKIVVNTYHPGDFVVCNLASLVLGNIDVTNEKELESIVRLSVRALDNVIDLNFYPVKYAQITNGNYRSIGLGTSGYHHMLAKLGIPFESDEHLDFVNRLYEKINYFAIKASNELAKEKGSYPYFNGSDWQTGNYFSLRHYTSDAWEYLKQSVNHYGLRNAYLLATAPTSSTSIIAGTTASIDPIMNKYFMEEKKGMMITRVAPDLSPSTFWFYKNAHLIDQHWLIKAAGIRQKHIDQAQSLNLYITNDYTYKQVLKLYIDAWKHQVKTIYYIRSKSLEIEECESCSA